MAFEEIEHTADVAIRATGTELADLFRDAALGMYSLMATVFAPGTAAARRSVDLSGRDLEELLVDWLSELAYLAESEALMFQHFSFGTLSPTRLTAELGGRKVEGIQKHIKAVTYHNLRVEKTPTGWTATVVFDV